MSAAGGISVVIVDDQAMVRAGFGALLAAQPDITVLGDAADGAQAVEMVCELRPDVVLMDVRMPVLDGLGATRQILDRLGRGASGTTGGGTDPRRDGITRVVMLTTFDIDDYVYEALAIGASGFLLKDAPAEELIRAVRVTAAGESLLAPSVTRRLIAEVTARRGSPPSQSDSRRLAELTAREREVLAQIARGLSNAEIAAALVVSEQTVKTHVSRVLGKLGLRDRAQAVVVAYETHLVRPG